MSNKKSIYEIYQVRMAWNDLVCDVKTRAGKLKSMGGEMEKKRALCTITWSLGTCHRNAIMGEVSSSDLGHQKVTHPL